MQSRRTWRNETGDGGVRKKEEHWKIPVEDVGAEDESYYFPRACPAVATCRLFDKNFDNQRLPERLHLDESD